MVFLASLVDSGTYGAPSFVLSAGLYNPKRIVAMHLHRLHPLHLGVHHQQRAIHRDLLDVDGPHLQPIHRQLQLPTTDQALLTTTTLALDLAIHMDLLAKRLASKLSLRLLLGKSE